MRIVRAEDDFVRWDPTGCSPGRGAYVCSEKVCLDQAVKRSRLERALRISVGPPEVDRLRREFCA